MRKCENCGASIMENAESCEYCGTKFENENANNIEKKKKSSKIRIFAILIIILILSLTIYTYFNLHNTDIITKDFGDFKISYTKDWEVVKSISKEQVQQSGYGYIFEMKRLGKSGYYSNFNISYGNNIKFNDINAISKDYAIQLVEVYNTNNEGIKFTFDKIIYSKFDKKDAAIIFINGVKENIKTKTTILYFLLENEYYVFYFNIVDLDNQSESDKNATDIIIDSIKFK